MFFGRESMVRSYEMILTSEPKNLLVAKETTRWPQRSSHVITEDHLPLGMDDLYTSCSHFVPKVVM
jgi:hypothetical protein